MYRLGSFGIRNGPARLGGPPTRSARLSRVTATAGAGYSLLFLGGLRLSNTSGSSRHRGGMLSALYLVGYLSMAAVALALGAVATSWGLKLAVDLGAVVITIMSIATFVLAVASRVDSAP